MKVFDIVNILHLKINAGSDSLQQEIKGGYVSDMLSDVLANAGEGNIWVTLQTHLNIIPVASMKGLAGIIIVNGRQPDDETLKKAEEEKIPILGTVMTAFQTVGKLYELGIK